MASPKVYFVGDSLGGWSDDFWPSGLNESAWDMVVFESNKPARVGDFNLIQQDLFLKIRNHVRQIITDGFTTLGAYVFPQVADNRFWIGESRFNQAGRQIHVGNPDNTNNAAIVQLPAPPSASGSVDYVYLEMWVQEVAASGSIDFGGGTAVDRTIYKWGGIANATLSNNLLWTVPSTPVEASRRLQVRWAIRSQRFDVGSTPSMTGILGNAGSGGSQAAWAYSPVAGSTCLWQAGNGTNTSGAALNSEDGYAYATPLAIVARQPGVQTIPPSSVTDLRYITNLNPTITINQNQIYPSLTVDNGLLHLTTAQFAYTGYALGSYQIPNGAGVATALDLSQSAYATRLLSGFTDNVSRVSATLSKAGTGADVTISIYSDATTVPGTTLLAQRTIPAAWLSTTPRSISAFLGSVPVTAGAYYWVVVSKNGNGTNHAILTGYSRSDANYPSASASDGSTWVAGANPVQVAFYAGDAAPMVHAYVNANDMYFFEYDSNGRMITINEAYSPASGAAYSKSEAIGYTTGGSISSIS